MFDDVLLVIIFHYPFYDTLPLILSNYEAAFPHIVICGPESSTFYEIMVVQHHKGYHGYECLGKAIELHPGFRGYLYVNDDMILNWWNFVNFDQDKVWLGAPIKFKESHKVGQKPISNYWIWWRTEYGAEACEKAHDEIKVLARDIKPLGEKIKVMLSILVRNGKNQVLCYKSWSDMFYVPGKFSRNFRYFSEIFFRNKVFLEIAVPTILSYLDLHENWEKTYGTYLPEIYGFKDLSATDCTWRQYSLNKTLFIHPVKFYATVACLNRKNFEMIVVPHGRKFLRC